MAYQVLSQSQWRSRLEISAEQGLTPMVNRKRELSLLHDCLARAESGRGQMVGLVGEAGIGKSRLLYELHTSIAARRVTWLAGQCLTYGQATPYQPFLDILRMIFDVEDEDPPLRLQEKLRQEVQRLDPALADMLPFLQALFDLLGADAALCHLTPKDKRQQTFQAIRAIIMACSQLHPLVLVFENLHWLDQTSEACLTVLLESLADMRVLVITTHRPGYSVPWGDKAYYTQLALHLLTEAESSAMVSGLLDCPDLPVALLRLIQEKADGNPLFIEEVTQTLREQGLVTCGDGDLTWSGEELEQFPATIHDIMQARIDRLAEPVKRTVQTAAVIGREFGLPVLSRLIHDATELEASLKTLKQIELIYETRCFPEVAYRFKHAVVQDAAYQSLLVRQRRMALSQANSFLDEAVTPIA